MMSFPSNPMTLLGFVSVGSAADWTSALVLGCCDSDVGRQGSAGCCPDERNRAGKSDKTASCTRYVDLNLGHFIRPPAFMSY